MIPSLRAPIGAKQSPPQLGDYFVASVSIRPHLHLRQVQVSQRTLKATQLAENFGINYDW